jgi:CheY-like chemotaxis protein
MVHGFAKQSGGRAKIYSEVGFGTTVRLYLQLIETGGSGAESPAAAASEIRGGNETLLVVEDDALVRHAATTALRDLGYNVIEAADGAEARAVLERGDHIDFLFTDIVMPGGITGRMLAEEAVQARPRLHVLYTSGYTDNTIIHQGRLDPGVNFLSKPYHMRELARRIRDMLDAGALTPKITVEGQ